MRFFSQLGMMHTCHILTTFRYMDWFETFTTSKRAYLSHVYEKKLPWKWHLSYQTAFVWKFPDWEECKRFTFWPPSDIWIVFKLWQHLDEHIWIAFIERYGHESCSLIVKNSHPSQLGRTHICRILTTFRYMHSLQTLAAPERACLFDVYEKILPWKWVSCYQNFAPFPIKKCAHISHFDHLPIYGSAPNFGSF
jgi:hypothetical protein